MGELLIERGLAMAVNLLGQDSAELIAKQFQKSAALITVGPGQIVLTPRPEKVLVGFIDIMNRLWTIVRTDGEERIIIWVLARGRPGEDFESRTRFMNVDALTSRLKALKEFKERATESRWKWLQSRAVIVLHDTGSIRWDVPPVAAFEPHHVLFSAVPARWAESSLFRALYGGRLQRLNQASISIFLGHSHERLSTQDSSKAYSISYYGHTIYPPNSRNATLRA
jgi:hypothetical protein